MIRKFAIISLVAGVLFAQSPFRKAFINIKKADRLVTTNEAQAMELYKDAFFILNQLLQKDLQNKKPSPNVLYLLGKLYLTGKGVKQNTKKAQTLLCYATQLGNIRAKQLLNKHGLSCPYQITIKELEQ